MLNDNLTIISGCRKANDFIIWNAFEYLANKDAIRFKTEYMPNPEAFKIIWDRFKNIPINNGIIQKSFLVWPKGTDYKDILQWFDDKYPGGVKELSR